MNVALSRVHAGFCVEGVRRTSLLCWRLTATSPLCATTAPRLCATSQVSRHRQVPPTLRFRAVQPVFYLFTVNLVHGGHVLDFADLEEVDCAAKTYLSGSSPLCAGGPDALSGETGNHGYNEHAVVKTEIIN